MMKEYPVVYNKDYFGPNVADVVYGWTFDDIPCYIGLTKSYIRHRCWQHLKQKGEWLFQRKLRKNQ